MHGEKRACVRFVPNTYPCQKRMLKNAKPLAEKVRRMKSCVHEASAQEILKAGQRYGAKFRQQVKHRGCSGAPHNHQYLLFDAQDTELDEAFPPSCMIVSQ